MRLPRIVEPLRHRDFRLLWTGQTLTLLGSFVSNIAFPFQVLQLGGSAFELGAFVSAFTGASLVFLLIGGAVADRVPRRTLIITTELASGVTVGSMAILGFAGALQMWHLYVAAVCFGAASAFSVPALGAIIPELVPDEILVAGNAVQGLSRQSARVGGPIVGGLLVATAGPAAAFAFNAVTFFLSAGAVALTRARPLVSEARRSIPGEIREGFAFVFSVQWLWVTIFGWSLIVAAFIGAIAVALPLLVTTVLGGGAVTYGIISAGVGVGEAIGATAIAQVRIRRSGVAMYLLGALMGVSFFIYGLVPTVPSERDQWPELRVLRGPLGHGAPGSRTSTPPGPCHERGLLRWNIARTHRPDRRGFSGPEPGTGVRLYRRRCDHGRADAGGTAPAVDP